MLVTQFHCDVGIAKPPPLLLKGWDWNFDQEFFVKTEGKDKMMVKDKR